LLHVGATTTATTTLANTGNGTADSLNYSGLGATASTGSITGSTGTGGPVNQANSVAVTQTYTAETAGADTVTGTATSVVGANSTGTATLAGNTSASVFVYSGAGVWTTNGGGTWGTTETITPANWQANGGIPGITPGFTTTDSALFGTALTSGSATVTLSGASPFLNNITFADTNANTSYTLAQGGSGIIHMDSTGTATIVNSNGNNTISAPVEFDSAVAASVATSDTLTLSGNITQTGTQSLAISGPGTTILSGSNNYSGGTTINSGSTFITNTSGSALGSGPLTVTAGSTFGGSGSATGLSSYTIGAVSSPVTTLQVGSGADVTSKLTLAATGASSIKNTNLEFNLNTTGASNQLAIGATALTLTGDTLTLNISSIGVITANTPYILIAGNGGNGNGLLTGSQYSGLTDGGTAANGYELINGLTLSFTGIGAPANWYNNSYVFLVNNGGVDDIEVEVVPEPSTWAMMIGGLALLVFIQRRRGARNVNERQARGKV
jgi:fibronectin-binding autotransporter adhesin